VVPPAERLAERIARACPGEGVHPSPLAGVSCIRISHPQERAQRSWRASVCIVPQGTKELWLEGRTWREERPHTIVSPIDLPVTSRVVGVSPQRPLLCLKLAFDAVALRDVADRLDLSDPEGPGALFVSPASDRLLEAAIRLTELFDAPADGAVLAPFVSRELLFHLLRGPDGPAICQLVRAGSVAQRIAQAMHRLQAVLDAPVEVDALARAAGMSRAAFFRRFKEATAMSPVQFQKRLRLLEARRLMVEEGERAESAAFRVGYRSASQFSREYARMFGGPPRRDAQAVRAAGALPSLG
jgi:AraC-like DNA-binding protein